MAQSPLTLHALRGLVGIINLLEGYQLDGIPLSEQDARDTYYAIARLEGIISRALGSEPLNNYSPPSFEPNWPRKGG